MMKNRIKVCGCLFIAMMFLVSCSNSANVGNKTKLSAAKEKSKNVTNKVEASTNAPNNNVTIITPSPSQINSPTPTLTPTPVPTVVPSPINTNSKPTVNSGNKKIIVIDPGHADRSNLDKEPIAPGSSELKIKDGGGAEGVVTKTPEYKVNMEVANRLKVNLESKGYTVVMTKTSNSVSLGNIERAQIGNNANANLVIRLHADSDDNSSTRGASMLVPSPINDNTKKICSISEQYGTIILNTYTSDLGIKNRGVQEHSDMTGFNWSTVPVILIEMGFLSNPDEDRLLSDSSYEDKIANALTDGICKAVN